MKVFRVLALSTVAVGQYVADTDGKCRLLEATCDHQGKFETKMFQSDRLCLGFHIVFDQTCRDQDYRAIQVNELYADGWVQSTTVATFGSSASASSECVFAIDPADSTKYKMDFNFKECSTDHPDSDTTDLIYRNTIQAQEYYNDIILGVKVHCRNILARMVLSKLFGV